MAARIVSLADGPILLALDEPQQARSALRIAQALCSRLDRSLTLIHAAVPALSAEELLERLELSPEELDGGVIEPLEGAPEDRIPRFAREHQCCLLMLGLNTNGQEPDAVMRALLSESPCPVLLVPPSVPECWGQNGTVLLPLDGSPSNALVAPLAIDLASRFEAGLDILYVAGAYPPNEPGTMAMPSFIDQPQYEWTMWRREFLSRFYERYRGEKAPREVRLSVATGDRAPAILEQAERDAPDLIVIGWHGNFRQARAQTMRAVLKASAWPVLLARI